MRYSIVALLAFVTAVRAADEVSALDAVRALPKTQHKLLVRLSAHGGKPVPEVWTVVTHDAKAAKGLRESTVASGTVTATRATSELIDKVTAGDVIGLDKVKVDSDALAELAASYADVNSLKPASFDFDLRREGEDAAPLWTITALDESGAELGSLVVAAGTGALVAQTSFKAAPEPADLTGEVEEATASASVPVTKTASTSKRSGSTSSSSSRERPSNAFRKVGGKLQKFFTGRDTISR
jgi:hypothetical protein